MTENADVEWLRQVCGKQSCDPGLPIGRARRLLAHFDQLEADNNRMRGWIEHLESKLEDKIDINVRPTIHEIAAANMQGLMARGTGGYASWQNAAVDCFDAAEALVAEGRRRDGLRE